MTYEIKIIQVTSKGCRLVYSREIESDKEMKEITMYNKKIHCFYIRELIKHD